MAAPELREQLDAVMGSHTEKILCPECGEAIKVPAGSEFEDVHKHSKPKPEPQVRASGTSRSQTIKKGTN